MEIIGDNIYKNTEVKLYLGGKKSENNYKYGDKISLIGNIELAETARNQGGFNYREYLKTKGIIRNS